MRVELHDVTVQGIIAGISLHAENEVVGIIGPNGSGKSTTLRCVYRALQPDAGAVLLDGTNVHKRQDVARDLAALTQESQVEFDFTVTEVVEMGRLPHDRDPARDSAVVAAALATVDVTHLASRSFLSLSGGERQRVLIARAIAQEPRVLVLDEPTNHLDIRHQLDVLRLTRGLGVTVLTVLHDLNLAASCCDRLHVLDSGRLVASGPPEEVLVPELIAEVFHVTAHVVRHPTTGVPQLLFDQEVTP
ncbi:ABC transporter ATP-binding protein [Lentzea flava]|uniref:ABC transporter ATP-binding protein n=1 Tax=Lentzea flava TaxID=103732 RepID=A0ABQ2V8D9_9PSEU|nr:ABC transporter ATP-binding protein [Lentzea flava]MCP2203615.1 iron complex transport system ATP-binding protein [Lentzea flava]GGU69720.1 ABC transporter ATP-binding protein [Lentzea flava]